MLNRLPRLFALAALAVAALWAVQPGAEAASGPVVAVDLELTPSGDGYWTLDNYGRVQALGTAPYLGGSPALAAGEQAVSLDPTPTGLGYWIFTSTGRVVAYGDAVHAGDLTGIPINGTIVDTATTADGLGYWMLGSEGGIFAFGSAGFHGSIQGVINQLGLGVAAEQWLSEPIVGLAPTASGQGYWLVAADGGMFSFGDAEFFGSVPAVLPPGVSLNDPVVGLVPQGAGYLLVGADGGIFNFGSSQFHGSIPGIGAAGVNAAVALPQTGAIVAVTVADDRSGYTMLGADGILWPFGSLSTLGALGSVDVATPANPGDIRNCADFATRGEAQQWFDRYFPFHGDPARLDADGDGVPCEVSLPEQQTIAIDRIPSLTVGASTTIVATATSGLPVTLTVSGPCTLTGTRLTAGGAGTCTVTARQPGNSNWQAAPDEVLEISVGDAAQGDSCGYRGLDDTGDMQVRITFTNPLSSTRDFVIDYAITDRSGAQVHAGVATVDSLAPGETAQIDEDSLTPLPPGAGTGLTCEVLAFFDIAPSTAVAPGTTCGYRGVDGSGDMQVRVTFTNPLSSTRDFVIDYGIYDRDGVRVHSGLATVDTLAAGETAQIDEDSLTAVPEGVPSSGLTCRALSYFGFSSGAQTGAADTCAYEGVDGSGDMQVTVRFTNPLGTTRTFIIDYGIYDAAGLRVHTGLASVNGLAAGQTAEIAEDTLTPVPAGVSPGGLSCRALSYFGF